ncbi:hypothetical protein KC343_g7853 [Hortaea werneckii]|nr:hypothetical protein KC352_g16257 [Hortaea werneckii]KAI7569529.1 hypothetical protein KC317_g3251 [Hortaea werneckii]KAI7621846.1 hypothetical protein KC343_g7853 [Hortaea werneckii]KAI7623265.1 hypothetical protein KC346_g2813 [Hortaea werneckii]KAI7679449.1 hypothetical protein KC319_g2762 [Hortaea werneckii]
MIFANTGLALVLAYLVEAVPNHERRTNAPKYNVLVTDKYDDLGRTQPVFVPGATQTFITSDGGVAYNNLVLATQPEPMVAGITAESSPNVAVFLQVGGKTTSAATTGLCFQPKKIYFGCEVMSAEDEAAVQVPCILTLTGHNNILDRDVGSQSFKFAPSGAVSSMAPAEIDPRQIGPSSVVRFESQLDLGALGLGAITSILTKLGLSDITDATLVTLLDNFSYIQYEKEDYRNCGISYQK